MIQLHSQITHLVAEIGLRADLDLCRPSIRLFFPSLFLQEVEMGNANKVQCDVSRAAEVGVR